uniref:ORF140 n=1 Tax=Leptospirillum ferrooxidans TaxID=180 RepID=Q58KH5_9BACT|nr:ORF140 [Leptospirillum ferrooxidans]
MRGLHEAGAVSKQTMRDFEAQCLPTPAYTAETIKNLREHLHVSQAVFAAYINASLLPCRGEVGERREKTQRCCGTFTVRHPAQGAESFGLNGTCRNCRFRFVDLLSCSLFPPQYPIGEPCSRSGSGEAKGEQELSGGGPG